MKTRKVKVIALLLSSLLAALSLSGCGNSSDSAEPAAPSTAPSESIAVYQAQLDHYAALTARLQEALIKEKEENFISECEYKLRIAELEDSVKVLSEKIGLISAGKQESDDKPTISEQPITQGKDEASTPLSPDPLASKCDFSYVRTAAGMTITGYNGTAPAVSVPSVIEGVPVTAIGESAFRGSAVTSVDLPASVTEIDWFAFADCTALQYIAVPSSVTKVGYGAFDRCPPSLAVLCEPNSYIAAYAASWGLRVE